jgi:hypothetical protein
MRAAASLVLFLCFAPAAWGQTMTLENYLREVRAVAQPELARCGVDVGLAAPAPPLELGLRWAAGRIQLDVRGLDALPKAKRAALLRCLRAVAVRVAGTKATLAPSPLALETLPPAPGPYDPADAHACQSPADCTIICEDPNDCCAGACGCSHAVNRAYVARVKAAAGAKCKEARGKCPPVGCAHEEYSATCENNRCKAVHGAFQTR